jgi:dephospho-CoA kinase
MLDYAIALTGSIATGKSTVCSILRLLGFRIIDADKIAHSILDSQAKKIEELFGKEFVKEKKVDRKALGKIVFADKNKRELLENLLHPLIKEEILLQAKKQEEFKKPYLIDIPLFFEKESYKNLIEKVIVVYTPREIQLDRLIKRDKITQEEALTKINTQIDIERKKDLATWVIDNSKGLRELQNECLKLKEEILKSF